MVSHMRLFFLACLVLLGGPLKAQTARLEGFADTGWNTPFADVKTQLKNLATSPNARERVEILMEEKDKYILVRRNEILYRYNFYKTPLEVARLENHELSAEEHDQMEAVLFHVKVIMPFIEATAINARLEGNYGKRTRTTVEKETGADIWELTGGFVFQWYEPYQNKAYTRTVDYLSAQLAAQIMKEYADYFDAREKLILKHILLR